MASINFIHHFRAFTQSKIMKGYRIPYIWWLSEAFSFFLVQQYKNQMLFVVLILATFELAKTGKTRVLNEQIFNMKATIHPGEIKVIQNYSDYGVSLGSRMTSSSVIGQSCQIHAQEIAFAHHYHDTYIPLIKAYTEKEFADAYENGKLTAQMPSIVSMTRVEQGAAVLTSEGYLYYISLQKDLKHETITAKIEELTNIRSKLSDEPSSFMIYNHATQTLFVVGHNRMLVRSLKNGNYSFSEHKHPLNISDVTSVKCSEQYLYIATTNGVTIMAYNGFKMLQLDTIKCKPQEIRVEVKEYSINILYVLDNIKGVILYIISSSQTNPYTIEIIEESWSIGGQGGRFFDFQGNNLMMIVEKKGSYQLIDYFVNYDQRTWTEINRWNLQGSVHDVDMNSDFAIVLGENGHHLYYHSIDSEFYRNIQQPQADIYIPSLKQIEFYQKDSQQFYQKLNLLHDRIVFGITKHGFFYQEWSQKPIRVECNGDQLLKLGIPILEFDVEFNSTQCLNKLDQGDDLIMCRTQQHFSVALVQSYIRKSHMLFLVVVAVVAAVGTLTLLFMFALEYYRYQKRAKELIGHQVIVSEEEMISNRNRIEINSPSNPTKSPISEQ